jgi:hypothetical protein
MEKAPGEVTGMLADDDSLPRLQLDPAFVLLARTMLRKQARPMP